ncbi:alanine racemase [Nocardioides mangrovi]|uniref:Alanine racemase n=1 Tax=Nocardioides mangrovi TaxID=2874580 RepID=A0ABS7UDM1_9ACTN|nr:alanine racemase [Nocardioides mangrovi]MBZ5738960.1 alanine racemase [Nocardioides mangrovi]
MSEPATPYLRVDVARLRQNIAGTAQRASAAGVSLRPHAKTHKSPEIARLQLEAGAVGLTVATIGEAEVFVEHGVEDLLIAYPLWPSPGGAARLRDLAGRAEITIGVDSVEAARHDGRLLAGAGIGVLVEVDSGTHRSGVAPEDAGLVAAAAAEAGLEVRGIFTFPGHSYAPDGRRSAADDEAAALREATEALRAAGIEPDVVSGGSTPSLAHSHTDVLTELRPGVYVFGDAQQWELGTMPAEDIALTCRATVVSHAGGRLVLDAGSKSLGADRAPYATGWGRLPAHPDARVVMLSEHHAVVELAGAPLPPLGSRVDVVPNHVCNAVNLTDVLWADLGDGALEPWPVAARGRND